MNDRTCNRVPHQGKLVQLKIGETNKLCEGCAAVAFDLPIVIRVHGEQSLFFNVRDKGLVCVTGCCHQSILTMADFGQQKIAGGETMYGVYGGLHISPFGPLKETGEKADAEAWFNDEWEDWMVGRFGVRPILTIFDNPVVLDNETGEVRVDGTPVPTPWEKAK